MIKAYFIVRRLAYFFGILGVIGMLIGRTAPKAQPGAEATWHQQAQIWGAGGVLICFLLLFITYGLYIAIKLRRK